MTEYSVSLGMDHLTFCSGHFITYGGGRCEPLHGHNYRAGVRLTGELDEHALVCDFVRLKEHMVEILKRLDHRMLLPENNPLLEIRRLDGEVEVRHAERRYVFPEADVTFLPIANTTAELLAAYLCDRLAERLAEEGLRNVRTIEVEVEESSGMSGACSLRAGD
jgi:6-pyruvoyltetrahydropterin/6-carboxytetrahydropterin synthase